MRPITPQTGHTEAEVREAMDSGNFVYVDCYTIEPLVGIVIAAGTTPIAPSRRIEAPRPLPAGVARGGTPPAERGAIERSELLGALGGFGALVTEAAAFPAALEAAQASGLPACVNVMIESVPAPVIRRPG